MFPLEPCPCHMPPSLPQHQRTRFTLAVTKLFRLGSHWSKTRFEPTKNQKQKRIWPNNSVFTKITSQPFAVCLAACKYQFRKWCHSGDAVNPVWTSASWWHQVETGSKMAPCQYSFHCVINGLSWSFGPSVTFLLLLSGETATCRHVSDNIITSSVGKTWVTYRKPHSRDS